MKEYRTMFGIPAERVQARLNEEAHDNWQPIAFIPDKSGMFYDIVFEREKQWGTPTKAGEPS
jgi:hypothetical protein